ncbi:MAG: hypothetical protein N5P05_000379 [Chroococcopsis gigantea SAG 12.99]|nr:hypothetical protein [Chroococcopsis gigantea SAG 12.99]
MLKVVLDSSVFTAAILSKNAESAPNKILRKWQQGDFTLIISRVCQEFCVKDNFREEICLQIQSRSD